jgi:hypothetical protein
VQNEKQNARINRKIHQTPLSKMQKRADNLWKMLNKRQLPSLQHTTRRTNRRKKQTESKSA